MSEIIVIGYENCNKALKAIGQNIIDRSDDITNDLEKVEKIIVHAELVPGEQASFNITKKYIADFKNCNERKD